MQHCPCAVNRREVHIYEDDAPQYGDSVAVVNQRGADSCPVLRPSTKSSVFCMGAPSGKRSGLNVAVADQSDANGKAMPEFFAEGCSVRQNADAVMSDTKAKQRLSEKAFPRVTAAMIAERDPVGEVAGRLRRIGEML